MIANRLSVLRRFGRRKSVVTGGGGGHFIGEANVTASLSSLEVDPSTEITVTYTITNATSAFIRTAGGDVALTLGSQDTYPFTPTLSGDFAIFATSANGGVVKHPLPFVVRTAWTAVDPTAAATHTSTGSGAWTTDGTWDAGTQPGANSIVRIQSGHTVTITSRGPLCARCIIEGKLLIQPATGNVGMLLVSDIDGKEGGELECDADAANSLVMVLFLNRPEHANDTVGNSPDGKDHFWPGLLARTGTTAGFHLNCHGPEVTGFVRLASEPQAGHTSLSLATAAVGWKAGDRIRLPDSRQLRASSWGANFTHQAEVVTLRGMSADGLTAYLLHPLANTHPGARTLAAGGSNNGTIDRYPHVANLSARVVFLSEDPTDLTTRAHIQVQGRAVVNCQDTVFHGLGRTALGDETASNVRQRHSFLALNAFGPTDPASYGLPATDVTTPGGWAVSLGGQRTAQMLRCRFIEPSPLVSDVQSEWGFAAIGTTSRWLIKDCVNTQWQSSNYFFDSGANLNDLEGCLSSWCEGNGQRLDGAPRGAGAGINARNSLNRMRNNVATESGLGQPFGVPQYQMSWYNIEGLASTVNVPTAAGDDPATTFTTMTPTNDAWATMSGNEAYGCCPRVFELWYCNTFGSINGTGEFTDFDDFVAWHFHEMGFFRYPEYKVRWNRAVVHAHWYDDGFAPMFQNIPVHGILQGDYHHDETYEIDADVRGCYVGMDMATGGLTTFDIANYVTGGTWQCVLNGVVGQRLSSSPGAGDYMMGRTSTFDGMVHVAWPGETQTKITFTLPDPLTSGWNGSFIANDVCYLLNHDTGGADEGDWELFMTPHQDSTYVPPQGDNDNEHLAGSPDGTSTNLQLLTNYEPWPSTIPTYTLKDPPNAGTPGLCVNNQITPGGAVTLTGVDAMALAIV